MSFVAAYTYRPEQEVIEHAGFICRVCKERRQTKWMMEGHLRIQHHIKIC